MKKKITIWLKKILGITALETKIGILEYRLSEVNKQIQNLEDKYQIGVDISPRPGESWAVICIQGKLQDSVRFVALGENEARDILRFIKQFDRNSKVIDAPMQYYPEIKGVRFRY